MPVIRRSAPLDVPLPLAFEGLRDTLQDIAVSERPREGFTLHVDFGDAALPDVGYLSIPIALEVAPPEDGLFQLSVVFRAQRHPESFPTFRGAFGVDSTGPTGVTLWLAGAYDVPTSAVGKIVDATVARGIAEHALTNLLEDVAGAVRACINRREADYMRHHVLIR